MHADNTDVPGLLEALAVDPPPARRRSCSARAAPRAPRSTRCAAPARPTSRSGTARASGRSGSSPTSADAWSTHRNRADVDRQLHERRPAGRGRPVQEPAPPGRYVGRRKLRGGHGLQARRHPAPRRGKAAGSGRWSTGWRSWSPRALRRSNAGPAGRAPREVDAARPSTAHRHDTHRLKPGQHPARGQPKKGNGVTTPSRRGGSGRVLTDVIVDLGFVERDVMDEAIEMAARRRLGRRARPALHRRASTRTSSRARSRSASASTTSTCRSTASTRTRPSSSPPPRSSATRPCPSPSSTTARCSSPWPTRRTCSPSTTSRS